MTDNELDQLMQRVLLDAIKSDCEKENSVVPSFEPSLRYQRSLAAMIADPLKWAHKRTKPLWKKVLQKVAIVLIVFSLSLGSLMAVSPNIRAAVVNWVTEWYETHITFRYLGTPTEDEMPEYTIGAFPNGYAEVDSEREEWPDYICIVYRNEVSGKTIYFDYTRMTQGYVNDFEVNSDTATSSVLVNGMQGYLFQEKNWERQRSIALTNKKRGGDFMKRGGLSVAVMVATVVMALTVSTYAITARAVNPIVGLSFQGTTAVCHAKCFAGNDNDNIQATLMRSKSLRLLGWFRQRNHKPFGNLSG